MKLFLDTAKLDEIKLAHSWGAIDGVTTNPSWIARDAGSKSFKEVIIEICKIVNGPVSAEVMSLDAAGMAKEGRILSGWNKHVVIKIPCTVEGLKACRELSKEGIKVNVTLVFSANQVLLAAKAGASYISPFVGRLADTGEDGMKLIKDGVEILSNYHYPSQILAASLREPHMVAEVAILGAQVATVSFKVLEAMYKHPLTDKGIEIFESDWKKVEK